MLMQICTTGMIQYVTEMWKDFAEAVITFMQRYHLYSFEAES